MPQPPTPAAARTPADQSVPARRPAAPSTAWDPAAYLRFADQRGRPFQDLVARVPATAPARVVDLGAGPGNVTALLAERWPSAQILGIDNSPDMVAAATAKYGTAASGGSSGQPGAGSLRFELRDLREWTADEPVDVLVTNAALQWVPGHIDLLPRLLAQLAPGGWFAMGVPGNFTAPSHALLAALQAEPRWAARVTGEQFRPRSHEPADYLRVLTEAGARAEVWETSYYYVLDGADGVLDFVSSTALRPVLEELGGADTAAAREFTAEYGAALREAYPPTTLGGRTVQILPYRRLFAVAQTPA